MLTVKHKHTRL